MCATINAFRDALACDPDANALYEGLGGAHRTAFHEWITEPQVVADRLARVAQAVEILAGRKVPLARTIRN